MLAAEGIEEEEQLIGREILCAVPRIEPELIQQPQRIAVLVRERFAKCFAAERKQLLQEVRKLSRLRTKAILADEPDQRRLDFRRRPEGGWGKGAQDFHLRQQLNHDGER